LFLQFCLPVRSGRNELEIEVTNLWPNRLIGDTQYPDFGEPAGKKYNSFPRWLLAGEAIPESAKRRTFAANNHWNKGAALLPSGLVGLVRILEKSFSLNDIPH
jgi:hypothetical protein